MTLLPCNSVASLYAWIERTTNAKLFFIEIKRNIVKETLYSLRLSCRRFLLSWRGTLYKRGGYLSLWLTWLRPGGLVFWLFAVSFGSYINIVRGEVGTVPMRDLDAHNSSSCAPKCDKGTFSTLKRNTLIINLKSSHFRDMYKGRIIKNGPELEISWPYSEIPNHVTDKTKKITFRTNSW